MTEPAKTEVVVNGTRLEVPTYRDPDSTHAIAAEVAATLKAIEESSERIDTQRFALEACMKLATDLARERDRTQAADDDLGLQLASVNNSVETLLKLLS